MSQIFTSTPPAVAHRAVHLDLKGHPPTFPRLLTLLDTFAALRYNVILVEWEDTFPWAVDPRFRSETAYTEGEVAAFCEKAQNLGIELIPLVQTLGHMENFLSAPERSGLRENPEAADVLNPLADGARGFVLSLLDDVLRLMPNTRRFHLGGDEAWTFGSHPQTKAYIETHSAATLFLHHMEPLMDHVAEKRIRPILWHDMLIHFEDEVLKTFASKCDLVVWGYRGHPDETPHHFNSKYTQRFSELGFTLWAGTAFKGADGGECDLPDLQERRLNAEAWLEIVQRHGMTGIIATGWSRYNFDVMQCEPIEASLDALLDQALLFHNGSVCHELTELPTLLDAVGEGDCFRRTQAAVAAFHSARNEAWRAVRYLRGSLAIVAKDPRRHFTHFHYGYMRSTLKNTEEAASSAQEALRGLTPDVWIESYLYERLKPLQDEATFIFSHLK